MFEWMQQYQIPGYVLGSRSFLIGVDVFQTKLDLMFTTDEDQVDGDEDVESRTGDI